MVHKNDLRRDLIHFKLQGIGMIINLLNKYDMRVIGVKLSQYQNICKELGITLISFPIQEMAGPDCSVEDFEEELIGNFYFYLLKHFKVFLILKILFNE